MHTVDRLDNLILVSPEQPWRFNFIQYGSRYGDAEENTQKLVDAFMNIMESKHRGRVKTAEG